MFYIPATSPLLYSSTPLPPLPPLPHLLLVVVRVVPVRLRGTTAVRPTVPIDGHTLRYRIQQLRPSRLEGGVLGVVDGEKAGTRGGGGKEERRKKAMDVLVIVPHST